MTFIISSPTIGAPDVTAVVTTLGSPGIGNLPSVTTEAQLGQVVDAWDPVLGGAKFIFLKVPVSTTITPGLLYQFDRNYTVAIIPASGTSKNTGVTVALANNAVTSSATLVQYTWFITQGTAAVLKTAVQVAPGTPVYMSTTAGRVKFVSSAGTQILGARTQNTATVTSTTSTVLVYLNYSSLEGA